MVEFAVVPDIGDGVEADFPEAAGVAHVVPLAALDAGDGGAHGVAVVVEVSDGVGEFVTVLVHGAGLATGDVVPVEHGPHFVGVAGPVAGDGAGHGFHVGVVGVGVGDDLDVGEFAGVGERRGDGENGGGEEGSATVHKDPFTGRGHDEIRFEWD